MNELPELVIALQAGQASYPALDYGVQLAGEWRRPVTILCVQKQGTSNKLEEAALAAREEIEKGGGQAEMVLERGSFEKALQRCLTEHRGALTLFSDLHKPVWGHFIRVGRFRSLMAAVDSPLLRIHRLCGLPRRILVCSGGLPYTIRLEKLVVALAEACSAQITYFHVVEPVTLDYSLAREVLGHWETLLKTNTPQARHLQSAQQYAKQAGLEARVIVRHGPLIHELFEEIRAGEYDLVAIGSAHSSESLRHLTRPDVAPLVGASFDCPVLTARGSIRDSYG